MNKMKLALTAFFAIAAAFGAKSGTDETKGTVKDIRLIKYKKRTITLSPEKLKRQIERRGLIDHTGAPMKGRMDAKYLLIYYSAMWCGGCRGFTPKLAEFYRENHNKYDFEIVFCSSDHSQEQMLKYIREYKMPWPCLSRVRGNFYIKLYGSRTILPNGGTRMGIPTLMIMNMTTGKCYGVPLFGEAKFMLAQETLERFKKKLGITDSEIQKQAPPIATKQ